ncbi:MAG: hypothetical protein ACI4U2_04345, partial [Christensenellaceae bacterium]
PLKTTDCRSKPPTAAKTTDCRQNRRAPHESTDYHISLPTAARDHFQPQKSADSHKKNGLQNHSQTVIFVIFPF